MIYEYKHEESGDIIELSMSMKDKIPEFLIKEEKRYNRIWTIPSVIMDNNVPKTVGSLAEKNTEHMLKTGKLKAPKPKKRPWWRKTEKVNSKLAKLSKKQKETYIQDGKI